MTRQVAARRLKDAKRNYINKYIKKHGCEPSNDDLAHWQRSYTKRVAKREREAREKDDFHTRLVFAMAAKGHTNKSLSELLYISPSVICDWRHKEHRYPSIEMLVSLSDVLEVSIDWLLKGGSK